MSPGAVIYPATRDGKHYDFPLGVQALIVDHNQLGHLPAQIGSLERLETLSCSHNLLLSLPASIGKLCRLKFLNCSSNKIISLPIELGDATAVEEINASDNYLQVHQVCQNPNACPSHLRASQVRLGCQTVNSM